MGKNQGVHPGPPPPGPPAVRPSARQERAWPGHPASPEAGVTSPSQSRATLFPVSATCPRQVWRPADSRLRETGGDRSTVGSSNPQGFL